VAPKERSPLALGLWITILLTAIPSLFYQNSGYVQFGYRFSLDYMVFFIMLLAVGGRRITWLWKAMLLWSIGVNLFGAITFDHLTQYSFEDSFFPHGNN
jgi:glucan phosphoethanolaminetransferase (alkaline phosphatase superfamily)